MSSNDQQQCKEFNNLKYKTMIMTGNTLETKVENQANEQTINSFLMKEMTHNKKQAWSRLTKTDKINKVKTYINTILQKNNNLTNEESSCALEYIRRLIERNKLTKNSELEYNEEEGIIKNIFIIYFNKISRKFTLNKEFKQSSSQKKKNTNSTKKKKTLKKNELENKIENEVKN